MRQYIVTPEEFCRLQTKKALQWLNTDEKFKWTFQGSKDNDPYHMRPGVFSCPRQCRFIDGGVAHPENDSSF